MGEPKTDYDPKSYDPDSLASVMRYITADLMIEQDVEGPDAFLAFQPQVVRLRQAMQAAYEKQLDFGDEVTNPVTVANIAEGVLLWLRDGGTVEDVLEAPADVLLERARRVGRK